MPYSELSIIFVAEEPDEVQAVLALLAESHRPRFSVRQVPALDQGLTLLEKERFDCLLIDLELPESRGLEAALKVRRRFRGLPIVVLGLLEHEEVAQDAIPAVIQDYLIRGQISASALRRGIINAVQRKRAAETLAESEERMRFAASAAGIGMWHWDIAHDELIWDERCRELFGFGPDSAVSYQLFLDALHRDDRPAVDLAVRRALQERAEYTVEMRVPMADGTLRWIMSKGRAFHDEQGRAVRMHGVSFDTTGRKEVEAALVLAKEEWERTFDSVPDLIAIMDGQGRILRMNQAMAHRLSRSPGDCIGLPCHSLVHGTDVPPEFCPRLQGRSGTCGETGHTSEIYEARLGGHYLVSTSPIIAPDGTTAAVIHVARDVSQLKHAEEEIRQLNQELAARAKELERVNQDLEAFNYTAAHDLRQPLSAISLRCQAMELICGDRIERQCLNYLHDIEEGTRRMSRLIDSLLRFSRMNRAELHRARVDLSALARGLADELKAAAPEGRQVEFRIAEGIEVLGDPELLGIVLDNLIGNAWKFAGNAAAAVIEVGVTSVAGATTCFVRDNGPGFDMAHADRLFAPFVRLPGAEVSAGFGIGLATVQRIVSRHGGRVWAESEPGRGATFFFTIPDDPVLV